MENKTISIQNIMYSSTVSSVFVSVICTPLDVIKNYIQYNNVNVGNKYILKKITKKKKYNLPKFNSFYYQTFKNIYSNYGFKAIYRGFVSTVNLYTISNTLFFYVYEELKEKNFSCYMSATISRFIAIILTSPLEIYRTNVQANVCNNNNKIKISNILKEKKNRKIKINLYNGITSTLVRDIPFSAIYWSLNEYFVNYIKKNDPEYEKRKNFVKKFIYPFICGCVSSTITTFITHPLDIIKTNMQARCIDIIHRNDFDYKKIKNYDLGHINKINNFYNICKNNFYNNKYIYDTKLNNNYAHNNFRTIYYKYGCSKYGSNTYNYKYYNYFKLTNNYNHNLFSIANFIFKRNGIKGFYIGIVPRLIKIVPTCAILYSTYHYFNY
ncbi:mitochondrial carrier protein, putative [Hepatocystis sp. ex Piliocolobus tephrosceles]|nr:mitochondrial carrier protein, putative [Hepatocystis sp. ex Piliocolobus tephrosceles]